MIKTKKSIKSKRKQTKIKLKFKTSILILLIGIGIIISSLVLTFALYIIIASPNFNQNLLYKNEATVLYNIKNEEIARIGSENRVLVNYEDLPQVLIDALIAAEDARFFQHNGLDGARFLMASLKQLLHYKGAGGASTISMQVIKNTYTGKKDTFIKEIIRKFTDIYMAVFKLESRYTKEEIIEFYVNSQWLGYDGNLNYSGIYGVEQASQYYFGKSVNDLSLAEASTLVGMFQNPTYYNPYKNPNATAQRRRTVLNLMVKHGYITEKERQETENIKIQSLLSTKKLTKISPYQAFIDYVIEDVEANTGINPIKTPMAIYTTLDPRVQQALISIERGEKFVWPDEFLQTGIAVTSVKDGSIVALSGGRNYAARGLNRATAIKRQPGSTAKPIFDYGPYLEYLNGSTYSMFLDDPYTYSNGSKIRNADNGYTGLVTMRRALSASRNIPALQAFQAVAKKNIKLISDFAHNLGIDYGNTLYESASIGSFSGTNPLQMSAAYAAFARGGYYIKPYSYLKAIDLNQEKEYETKATRNKVMSEETAYMITNILETAYRRGVGGSIKTSGTTIAAKGGTTNIDKKSDLPRGASPDSWNITYSPDYCIALWIGYDVNTKEHYLTMAKGGRIRRKIMGVLGSQIYLKNSKFKKPNGVLSVEIELETFPPQLPSEFTPDNLKITELFRKGTQPTEISSRFSQLEAPINGNYRLKGTTINLSWDAIDYPNAINLTKLQEHFNEYYHRHSNKYYQRRIAYNNKNIGTIGYQIYLKDNTTGNLKSLGFTNQTNYSYPLNSNQNHYTFFIKSAYSIFKANQSNPLVIDVSGTTIDENIENIVDPSLDNSSESNDYYPPQEKPIS